MQKGRPAARLSMEPHDTPASYAEGYSAGYEAGRRVSLGEGTQQGRMDAAGRRFSDDAHYQRSPSQDRRGLAGARQTPVKALQHQANREGAQHVEHRFSQGKTQNGGRLSDGFQGRKSFDESHASRDHHIQHREHEMNGQVTDPSAGVQFQARGHY